MGGERKRALWLSGLLPGVEKLHDPGVLGLPIGRLLPFVALWTMHVWIYWFNTTSFRLRPSVSLGFIGRYGIYAVMTLVMLGAAVVFLLISRRGGADTQKAGRFDIPMTVLMAACTLAVVVAGLAGIRLAWWYGMNVLLAGMCMAWGYLRWSMLYARLGIRDAVGCLFASYLLGSSFKVVLDLAPTLVGGAVALALPLISTSALRRAVASPYMEGRPMRGEVFYRAGSYATLLRVAVCVFVFCLGRRLMSLVGTGGVSFVGHLMGHGVEIVFALAVLAWVYVWNRALDFPQLWRFVFLFVTTTVVLDCLDVHSPWASVCSAVATSLIVMLLWLTLSDVAHHCDLHPYVVFGLGWSLYVGANFLGSWMMQELGVTVLTPVDAAVLLWVLGVTMAFCLETRSPDVQRIFADLRTKVDPEEFATIDARCDQLAREYSLTERELDVLKLLAKGRSRAFVAEALFISENTVRGHARRLYAKLGVHTREELQGLLGL